VADTQEETVGRELNVVREVATEAVVTADVADTTRENKKTKMDSSLKMAQRRNSEDVVEDTAEEVNTGVDAEAVETVETVETGVDTAEVTTTRTGTLRKKGDKYQEVKKLSQLKQTRKIDYFNE